MKNKFEHILLSLLLGTSVLLGLSFWLNVMYGFNLFYYQHWNELSELQASQTPVNTGFYISIIIAILIFVIGIYVIYRPRHYVQANKPNNTHMETNISQYTTVTKPEIKDDTDIPVPNIPIARPPRLNLPSNMAQIITQRKSQTSIEQNIPISPKGNPYDHTISQIFSDNGYVVKPNPKISGFTPNLFAIGPDEVLWIGAIDVKIEDLQRAVDKLQSVFKETLEDIQINIAPFILDTSNQQQTSDSILIFKNIDELKTFIAENPARIPSDEEHENFDSYSEYIDTVIQYIKNI